MIIYLIVTDNGQIITAFINKQTADQFVKQSNDVRLYAKPVSVQDAQSMPDHA